MKILIVEDDRRIAAFIRKGLKELGYTLEVCHDGNEGFQMAQSVSYDVILLDIMLPGRDGLSILRELREANNPVPVILLTARSGLDERVEGLNMGADDYLPKPFYMEELIARIMAVSRRNAGDPLNVVQHGNLTLNLISREVRQGNETLELTSREFSLLELLIRSPGRVYSRTQLLEHVWGYDFDPRTNVVDVYIRRVRGKIDAPDAPSQIETVRGVGYRFKAEQ
ncbi:response regulator transcription factor [Pontiella sp.]|uniref:response regulator transcription factor n=1 Tax=Pontiella sp. TaxID=2837462 RepID=UPI00356399C5